MRSVAFCLVLALVLPRSALAADNIFSRRHATRNLCTQYLPELGEMFEEFRKEAANGRCDVFSSADKSLQRSTYDFGAENAKSARADCEVSKNNKYTPLK